MACFSPLLAWQTSDGEIVFAERGDVARELKLPCGRCIGCRLDRSQAWAVRCLHEAQMHEHNVFVTLTYNEQSCPLSLEYGDFQKFLKRLRKLKGKVRYFCCGEYGELGDRPHFHALLFGVFFEDRELLSDSSKGRLYRSSQLERLWPFGYSSIGDVCFETANYVASYCVKKVNGDRAKQHYTRLDARTGELLEVSPEFGRMSLKPGIGADWFSKFNGDVFGYDRDGVVLAGGRKVKAPRFYDKKLEVLKPDVFEAVQFRRSQRTGDMIKDMEESRLRVREAVKLAQFNFKRRTI